MKLPIRRPDTRPHPVSRKATARATALPPWSLLRAKELREIVSLSRTQVWRLVGAGEFPKPVRLSKNAVAWRRDEIEAWVRQRERA